MKLSKQQIGGLIKSAKKWEDIYNGVGIDDGNENCELCRLYFDNDCINCPIFLYTNQWECQNTPYPEWSDHQQDDHEKYKDYKIACPTCKILAKKEWDFILSLIPKEDI